MHIYAKRNLLELEQIGILNLVDSSKSMQLAEDPQEESDGSNTMAVGKPEAADKFFFSAFLSYK